MNTAATGPKWLPAFVREPWQRFWHAEAPTLSLALFRVLFAYCLWREVGTTRRKAVYAIDGGGFHLPYLDFIPTVSEETFHLIQDVQYLLIVLLAIGLFARPACAILLALQGYVFFADQLHFRNHPYFFLLVLLLLLLSPMDDAFSVRALWRRFRKKRDSAWSLLGGTEPLTFQRLIAVQVCIAYLFAGLQKINPGFLRGEVLESQLDKTYDRWSEPLLALFGNDSGMQLAQAIQSRPALIAAALATLGLEIVLPITLWFRKTRAVSMVVGIGFHLSILFLMKIHTFSLAMIGSYLLFLDPETIPSLLRGVSGRRGRGSLAGRETGAIGRNPG